MMRASVIVPAYNVAPYLSRCIESLLVQTERSIEILIIDDGSTDGITPELVDSLARGDSRVRAIHRANGGLSAARNAGLDAAAGEFVCFVDGDDWAEPNMVESMITACELEATPVAIAGAYVDFHDQDERLVRSERRILPRYVIDRSGSLDAALVDDNFINLVGYAWNKLYHRNWLLQTGAVFEGGLSLIEDIEFNARVLTVADRVVLVPDAFIHYVQRPRRTLGTTFDETYLAKRQRSLLAVDSLLTTWGVDKQARARGRVGARGLAMWGALKIAAETPHPVTTLRMMLEHPSAESIFSDCGPPAGWRGRWASGTLRRGWHRTALTPLLARAHLKRLRERLRR